MAGSDGTSTDEWLSAHLHFRGDVYSPTADALLIANVFPFVERCRAAGWASAFFYVRYSDDGAHIRLRLRGAPHVLNEHVAPALADHVQLGRSASFDTSSSISNSSAAPIAVDEVRWIRYEPEIARYGGEHVLHVSETLFCRSSDAAMLLLRRTGPFTDDHRLGVGLVCMLTGLLGWCGEIEVARQMAAQYASGFLGKSQRGDKGTAARDAFRRAWERQREFVIETVREAVHVLGEGDPVYPELRPYHIGLVEARGQLMAAAKDSLLHVGPVRADPWVNALWALAPSHIHMMSNRLGLRVAEEAFLAYLIEQSLGVLSTEAR
jgi:thiopeptide-type bacteriocin biosynthesis protein